MKYKVMTSYPVIGDMTCDEEWLFNTIEEAHDFVEQFHQAFPKDNADERDPRICVNHLGFEIESISESSPYRWLSKRIQEKTMREQEGIVHVVKVVSPARYVQPNLMKYRKVNPVEEMGSRIETLRKRMGFTQKALADAMGVTQQQINRWESGEIEMKATSLAKAAKALGVSSDFLLGL